MKQVFAKRPNFSDVEDEQEYFGHMCKNCWQTVYQPYIKGLWYHDYNFPNDPFGCQNLIPIKSSKINRDKIYTCSHEYRFHPDLKHAVKCVKCNHPLRFALYSSDSFRADYFCFGCNKQFKNLTQHYEKTHNWKGFEFSRIR